MSLIKHIEIAGVDGDKLESFYRDLLGWSINRDNIGGYPYGRIDTGGDYSAAIRHEPEGKPEIVLYVEVDNVDESVERAKELGATVKIPPMDGGPVYFALIQDPEGNPIGLTQNKPDNQSS